MAEKKHSVAISTFTQGTRVNKLINCSFLIIFALTICHISSNLRADDFANPTGAVVTGMYLLPFVLLGGLYGYVISYVVFLLAFIASLAFYMHSAYAMIIYLIIIYAFAVIGRTSIYKSFFKTFLLCLGTVIIVSLNGYLCYTSITSMDYSVTAFLSGSFFTTKEVSAIYLGGLILHLLYKYAPDSVKMCFPLTILATKKFDEDEETKKRLKATKVSDKITLTLIGVVIILGICVALFMMVLFPDIKTIFTNREKEINEDTIEKIEDFNENINEMDFQIDEAMISFDLKMVFLMICVGVPLAGFANFYTRNFIAGPLGEMSDFMEQYAFASDDDKIIYGHKIDDIYISSNDEIKTMYDAIYSTVYEMEAYIGRVKEEQLLRADLEIAKQASQAKSSFLSNMSHEIRTPINAVLGMNEMILRECDDETILEYATNIRTAGDSLLTLVNDILDFSKIEAGKMEIISSQYQLGSTVNDLINMVSAKANEKNLVLNVNVDEHIPSLLIGDEVRIKQCVTNILSNAVKYTEEGSVTLDVSFEKVDDNNINLRFSVTDTGIGIKEEDLSKLFSPFERIEESRNRTIEGTGLGMSIVKKLLSLMDSRLEVESVYSKGSKFAFSVKQQVVAWDEIGDFKEKYKEYVQSAEAYHSRFTAPTAKILVVDDTEMNLTVVKSLLKQTLVQIDTAISGFEALDMVKQTHYDVIFLDHRMPEMDGIETFEKMKTLEDNQCADVPVIALTANAVSGAKVEYVAHGFTDYLAKPVNGYELEKMLEFYLPSEKIDSVSIFNGESDFKPNFSTEVPEDSFLKELRGVDLESAVANCGGADVLENVVRDFYISIDSKAVAIKDFLDENDIRNYTVLVHALKSSARLIGASVLSDLAAEMEEFGNSGNVEELKAKTPDLLSLFLEYKEYLKACDELSDDDKPEIAMEELERALKDIKELVEAYDFDTADSILGMLQEYKMPEEFKSKYLRIKELVVAVDRDELLKIL